MKEKDLYAKVHKWARAIHPVSAVYEVKLARSQSLPFSALAEHQERALKQAKRGVLSHKIADDSIGFKPADILVLAGVESYVLIFYPKEQERGTVGYAIDIDAWCKERETCGRKSCPQVRARAIAAHVL